ncbi:hypothetical protein TrVGV298_003648 [Trichoderma virens]|nr:hypothetical protein TrVGV298_003648 [Trichoderma virens]
MHVFLFLTTLLAAYVAYAAPIQYDDKKVFVISQKPTLTPHYMPQAKSATVLANVTDPDLSRDSCGSVKMGSRTLWTCRDTSVRIPGTNQFAYVFANTAGWTDHQQDDAPAIQVGGPVGAGSDGANSILLMNGPRPTLPTFYPLGLNMCPNSGACDDGASRWTAWPDSPPMVTETALDGTVTAYTWVSNNRMAIRGEYAYLFGLLHPGGVALARVPVDCIENKSQYEYYVRRRWTSTKPAIDDPTAAIPNAGTTGQGTFYYSDRAQSYVWIGQASLSVSADFYIATAPSPEGPWTSPYLLYSGPNGDGDLPSYSLQAHPHLLREYDDGIYLTWTQYFKPSTYAAYVTPLVYVSFV